MPRNACCISGCPSVAEDGVPLHYFPNPKKEAKKFQNWMNIIGGDIANLDSTTIYKTIRICRRHFRKEFLYPKNRLCKLSVPSLLLASEDLSGVDNIVLHAFPDPEKEKERFSTWMKAVGGNISSFTNDYIYKNRKICHDHFEEKYLTWSRRLADGAIPTLHISGYKLPEDKDNCTWDNQKDIYIIITMASVIIMLLI